MKHFRSVQSSERENIISKNQVKIHDKKSVKRSLEPLTLNKEISDSDSDEGDKLIFYKLTRTGYIPLCAETGFRKKQNQDSLTITQNYMGINDNYFFGVFDGHGVNGAKVSGFLKDAIPDTIKRVF
jgi:hypothetical protein